MDAAEEVARDGACPTQAAPITACGGEPVGATGGAAAGACARRRELGELAVAPAEGEQRAEGVDGEASRADGGVSMVQSGRCR